MLREPVVHGRGASLHGDDEGADRLARPRVEKLDDVGQAQAAAAIPQRERREQHDALSERTHQLDTEASASALRDVFRSALGPAARDRLMASIRDAHDRSMTKSDLAGATRTLPRGTQRTILDAFDSEDVINLPACRTAWRASNAVSWVARHTEDLERAAGALV